MTARKGLPAKLASTDADDTRYDFRNLVVCNADGTPRGGVTAPTTGLVSATATMNVSVAALSGVAVRDGGAILLANDGPANVLLGNAPVSNSRIDVVYQKQNDASSTVTSPDANNNPILGVAAGTASASPVKPSIPVGAIELASILIPSTATATNSAGVVITQTAQYTAGAGGDVPFKTKADLDAWTTARLRQHAIVFADTVTPLNNGEWEWDGTKWTMVGASAWVPFTPTLTNITLGNGTLTAFARRLGGNVEVIFDILFGSTTAMGTIPRLSRPIAAATLAHKYLNEGVATGYDLSADTPYIMGIVGIDTTTVQVVPNNSGVVSTTVNPAAPFTWAVGDHLSGRLTYLAA